MRELPEEIKLTPRCHCDVPVRGFEDVEYNFSIVYCRCGGLISAIPVSDVEPFDITKHEFSDGLSISNMCKSSIEVAFDNNEDWNYVPLHKDDAIAIAKHFGVTAEDLK